LHVMAKIFLRQVIERVLSRVACPIAPLFKLTSALGNLSVLL